MSHKKHEKQELPNGWVVKQSRTYQDRVYYFNTLTGVSTWDMPAFLKPYLKSSVNKSSSKHVVSSRSHPGTIPAPVEARVNIQEAQFSPTQDSDDDNSLELDVSHDRADFRESNPAHLMVSGSGSLHLDNNKQIHSLDSVKHQVKTDPVTDLCLVNSQIPALEKSLKSSNEIHSKSYQPASGKKVQTDGSPVATSVHTQNHKASASNSTAVAENSSKSEKNPRKLIRLSTGKASYEKVSNLKRSAESLSQNEQKKKHLKTDRSGEADFSDTRKVVKRSPSSTLDTCNLSPRESSPDYLLLNDPKKREDIQSWINRLESDDPPSDSIGDFLDQNLERVIPNSGVLGLKSDNRKVIVRSSESGCLSLGETSNLNNITMTIKNDGPVKKAVVNPWKGVHENPVPVHHNRREEISMEIDEIQQVLTKEDEREIEEMDVSDIVLKEVRDSVRKCPSEVIGKLTQVFTSDQPGHIESVDQGLYIVVDTNVFISNLSFVEDLRDYSFENLGLPVLVIPWVVMQELDALKSNKSSVASMSMKIGKCARAAVGYIYQCFQDNHQRVIGQSAIQASAASEEFQAECNDDRILQTCLQCQKIRMNSTVVLLTNDKNLLNKAKICKIQAFDRYLLINGIKSVQPIRPNQLPVISKNIPPTVPSESVQKPSQSDTQSSQDTTSKVINHLLDEMLCKLKMWLKNALSSVLEREMKAAYDDIWLEIVFRKPPWTLSDVLECFKKHWIAVFGQIFKRSLSTVVDRLCARFKPVTHFQLSLEILLYLLNDCLEFLEECNKHYKDDPSVVAAVTGMKKCQGLCRDLKIGSVKVNSLDAFLEGKQFDTESKPKECMDKNKNKVDLLSIEDVESKLTNIWDVVYFCCEDFQKVVDNRRKNGSTDPDQLQKMLLVFQKLIPALDGIRYEYEQALRFSPKEITDKAALVHGLCVQLNSFYIRLNLEAKDGNLDVTNLQALFAMESKRYPMGVAIMTLGSYAPSCHYDHTHRVSAHNQQYHMGQMLKDGLDHLDKMIHKIHEQVRMSQE